jgi:hypothetical protein
MAHLPFDVLLTTFCKRDDYYWLNGTGLLSKTEHSRGNACTLSLNHLHDKRARRHDADQFVNTIRAGKIVLSFHPGPLTNTTVSGPSRRDVAGFSPHLCPLRELPKTPAVTTHAQRLFL